MPKKSLCLVAAICLAYSTQVSAADFIWVEGENAKTHNMVRHGWYDSVTKESLSGNEWLSHYSGRGPGEVLYEVPVASAGDYHFWVRANTVAGPRLSYQIGDGAWTLLDMSKATGNANIASDGKPDMRFIAWVDGGKVTLPESTVRVRFRCDSKNNNHGAIDCFVFSSAPFVPRGALKPGERTGKANPGFFAWEPETDLVADDALVDVSYLNEDVAGQDGYVRAQGENLVLGDGTPLRFWGANGGPGIAGLDHQSHVYLAKTLAKRGVNLVRLHGGIYGSRDPKVNYSRLDNLHHLVSALKDEGIYTKLSFYFPAWFRLDDWHKDGDKWPFMLLFFDADMQRVYFNWAKALLTTPNPYTGVPLGKDPAVAMVEIQNEDSHFFWTFKESSAPPERWAELCRQYGAWLAAKYGSLEKATAAWGGAGDKSDRPAEGRMHLHDAWRMTGDGRPKDGPLLRRMTDQVQFLTENMRGFYLEAIKRFENDFGYEGLVSCGNWHTADARMLDALERYCYTAGDVIDHHGYFDHHHKGDAASYSVRPGQTMKSASAISLDLANPLPNLYRGESAFLTSAYGAMWGLDGVMNFAIGSASWDQSVGKFVLNNPAALGSYFAAALVYRKGWVREAPAIVREELELSDLYSLNGSSVYVKPALDQFRAAQIPEGQEKAGVITGFDPLSFYAGRVLRAFGEGPEGSMVKSTAGLIDRAQQRIESVTGDLAWDYGAGVVTMDTPHAQGAAGFLGRGEAVVLEDVIISMKNDYGTVMVVALDDQPIADSKRILIQCMTVDQLYGWKTSEPGGKNGTIQNVGSAPWGVEEIDVTANLRFNGAGPWEAVSCDENGYARATNRRQLSPRDGAVQVTVDPSAVYTVLVR